MNTSKRLLDFGAGWGLLLRAARARGWECAGIELADRERASLQENGFEVFARLEDVPDESFDAVGSTQVLEHVADFHTIVGNQAAKLRPGGLLYIDVPNAGVWARRQAGLFANPLEHVNYFTHHFLSRRLLDSRRFELVWPRLAAPPKQAWRALRQHLGGTPLTVVFRKLK
jgi:2-polyprenyl-3-methyl-5-hydroxy-6-metoxy-1,4-benzoquinol methylase